MIQKFYKWFHAAISQPEEAGEYSAGYWQDKVRRAALGACIDKSGKLLEVGCGEGLFLKRLGMAKPGIQIWGIDRRDYRLKKAEVKLSENGLCAIKLEHGDALSLPFAGSFFDTVVCVNVFFNMASIDIIKMALREMGRVCAIGGSLIFDYRNGLNWLLRLKYNFAHYYDPSVKDEPFTTCRPDEIEPFLKEMGFEIKHRFSVCFPRGKFTPIILLEAVKLK